MQTRDIFDKQLLKSQITLKERTKDATRNITIENTIEMMEVFAVKFQV